jgi:hypothetical protein
MPHFPKHPLTNVRLEATGRNDIHRTTECVSEDPPNRCEIEQIPVARKVDQHINIRIGTGVAAGDGAEDAQP